MLESVDPKLFSNFVQLLHSAAEDNNTVDHSKLESAVASSEYYTSFEDKVSSIVRSLIKNHAFTDGNKRVAALFFLSMVKQSGKTVNLTPTEMVNLFVDIASSHYSVEEISHRLFQNVHEEQMRRWINITCQ